MTPNLPRAVVREGLNDRSEKVREACTKMICESWADEQLLTYFGVIENEVSMFWRTHASSLAAM